MSGVFRAESPEYWREQYEDAQLQIEELESRVAELERAPWYARAWRYAIGAKEPVPLTLKDNERLIELGDTVVMPAQSYDPPDEVCVFVLRREARVMVRARWVDGIASSGSEGPVIALGAHGAKSPLFCQRDAFGRSSDHTVVVPAGVYAAWCGMSQAGDGRKFSMLLTVREA